MKKIISILMTVAMLCGMLSGCYWCSISVEAAEYDYKEDYKIKYPEYDGIYEYLRAMNEAFDNSYEYIYDGYSLKDAPYDWGNSQLGTDMLNSVWWDIKPNDDEVNRIKNLYNLEEFRCIYDKELLEQVINFKFNLSVDEIAKMANKDVSNSIIQKGNYWMALTYGRGDSWPGCELYVDEFEKLSESTVYAVWHYENPNDYYSERSNTYYTILEKGIVAGKEIVGYRYLSTIPPSNELLAQYTQQEITVTLNDSEIAFDQPPIIKDDRTLIPMRAIFEAMGCEVIWDGDLQQVDVYKDGDNVMTLWIDEYKMWTENEYITLDVPPQIIGERTLVPVRAISEALDCDVDWNGDTRTVIITAEEDLIKTKMVKIYQYDDKSLDKADFEKTIKINDTEYNVTYKQTEKYDWKTDNIDSFEFTINGSKLKYNDYFDYYFSIKDVYLADLDPNDKCVELLISTVSDSATNTITAFQYKNGRFSQLKFHNTWVMNEKNNLELFLGSNYHGMVMNEDNSITLTGKTSSYGMWGIKKTFRLDKNNRITQDNQDMYEVDINEFMDRQTMTCDDLMRNHYIDSESEYDMYLNNYALCKRDYGCLKKGDYFTIVYDDDKGNVFVRTTDGKEGWIEIKSLSTEVRESISKLMFYMAS